MQRVLFIKDGEVFHQLYRGNMTNEELYAKISDTLTILTAGRPQDIPSDEEKREMQNGGSHE